MKSARWEIVDAALRVWLGDTSLEPGNGWEPPYHWITALLANRPFILIDVCAPEEWGRELAARQHLPMGLIQGEPRRQYLMFGCTDPAVLEAHCEDEGVLAWISGLHVVVFESESVMLTKLATWNGQPFPVLSAPESGAQFTLATYADYLCLIFTPGQEPLDKLFAAAEQTAARLGYSWAPLRS